MAHQDVAEDEPTCTTQETKATPHHLHTPPAGSSIQLTVFQVDGHHSINYNHIVRELIQHQQRSFSRL